jgi:LmbE family N-acetylglucosaminyl deacetylase
MREAAVVVAHADDETLGAGGTIVKLLKDGWKVSVVVFSDTYRFGGDGVSNREGLEKACRILGVQELHVLDVPDQQFDAIPMAVFTQKLMDLKLAPDLIITNADNDLNLDHRITSDAAKILGRPRRRPVSILACESPAAAFWNGQVFQANYFVDITSSMELKVKAFEQYVHEIQKFPNPWSPEGLRLLAQYHGMQCGFPFAEAFYVIRAYEGRLL